MVDIMSFERQLTPALTENAGVTADGSFHYESRGMVSTCKFVFRARPGMEHHLQWLWEDLKAGGIRECTIPDGKNEPMVPAYVTGCTQSLLSTKGTNRWDCIEARFRLV